MIKLNKKYTKKNPSKKYIELTNNYKQQHLEDINPGVPHYEGISLEKHITSITDVLKHNNCKTLLDYGAGKGILYTDNYKKITKNISKPVHKHWNLDSFSLYEVGDKKYSKYPEGKYDAVICTDVIEHIWKDDLYWFTKELCSFAQKLVYVNVACYAAKKTFNDGTNVHVSIYEPKEWIKFFHTIRKDFDDLKIYLVTQHQEMVTEGTLLKRKGKNA